uniref:exodeoxyribonuclease III n=1 Tax=Sinocyclocheilus rhinocerous TaxID=307959 RepID=A0A673MHH2_9TELE
MAIHILSWNVNGLNSPIKRTKCLDYLRCKKVSIALIQESHLKSADVHRFQNKYFKVISSSSAVNKTKGVLDSKAESLILEDCLVVLGGDFNAVLGPQLDRSHASKSDSVISGCFNSFLRHSNICDVWCLQNDGARDYTFFSARHKSYSRTDYLLMSPSLIPYISKVNILPIILSDHFPLISPLTPTSLGAKRNRWRFNTSLLQDCTFVADLRSYLMDFLQINRDSASDPQVLWETTKCFIRGKCLSFSSFNKKRRESRKFELEKQIDILEKELKDNFCETKRGQHDVDGDA